MQNKIIGAAVFAASTLLFISTAYAQLAPAPAPCATTGTPFLTLTQNISNDPDSGNQGNWATDAFTENVNVWLGTDGTTYCATANTTNGTFVTTGPLSPEKGVALAAGIDGTFTGGENYTLPLTLNASYDTGTPTSPQVAPLPDSSTAGFSTWVSQVFSDSTGDGSNYVNTYSLTYITPNNGTWTDADGSAGVGSGGDTGDITGAPCSTMGSPLLVNVTQQISNDPDSGNFGGDWAIDNFIRHIQIWQEGAHYCAQADDSGTFTTFGGTTGKSPQSGAALPEIVTGTMIGGTHGEITGATLGDAGSWGNTGTTSVAEDCGGSDCSMTDAWVNNYFAGGTYDYGSGWGWTYDGGANGTWVNASSGSSGDIIYVAPPAVTTESATGISSSDATLVGQNGPNDASQTSFWVSLAPFDTSTPNIPADVYSTPVFNSIPANSTFSTTTVAVTQTGIPSDMPAITPDTTYYYVAWSNVGNTWYPGTIQHFTTLTVHMLTYTAGANGSLTGATSQTVDDGTDGAAVTAVADLGYHFTSWSDNSTANPRTDTDVTGDITVTAGFAADSDLTALNAEIAVAQADAAAATAGTDPGDYSQSAIDTLNAAISAAQTVSDIDDQSVVDAATATLTNAVTVFTTSVVPPSDLTALSAEIVTAQGDVAAAVVGMLPGDYSQSSVDTLNAAIVVAQGVTSAEPQSDVNAAATTLNSAIFNFKNSVVPPDTTPPVIAAHGNSTVEATSASGAIVTYTSPATSDNVDPAGVATCSPLSGSTFPLGINTVTCNAKDAAGNKAAATTFTVTVHDTTAPAITPTADMTVEATSSLGVSVTYTTPTATDAVDGTDSVSCTPVSSSLFALGNTGVTCSSTDAAGNTGTSQFTIHVVDTTAPVITLNGAATINLTVGQTYVEQGATATDAVDGTDAVVIGGTVDTSTIGTYTVTYDAQDAAGNKATEVTRTVIVAAAPVAPAPVSSGGGGGGNGPIQNGGGGGGGGTPAALPNNGSTATSTTGSTGGTGNSGGQVLGASVYEFTVDFGIGTQDNDVTQLQTILTSDGFYSGPIIGSFGPLTKAAVIKFQIANGINPTGYVGPLTRAVLNKGATPTLLQELESQLAALMTKLAALQAATSTSATSTAQ